MPRMGRKFHINSRRPSLLFLSRELVGQRRSGTKKVASKGMRAPQLCPPLLSEETSPLTVLTKHRDGYMAVGGMVQSELVTEHVNRNSNKTSQGCHPEHPLPPLACCSPSVTVLQSPWPLCHSWTCLACSALTCLSQGPGILPVRLISQVPKRLALSSLLVLQGEASPTTQSKTAVSPHPSPPSWWFHLWNIWHVTNSAVYWLSTTACLLPTRLSVLREHWCLFSVLSAESPGLKQCLALSTRLNKYLLSEWKKMESGGDDQRSCFQVCLFRTHKGTYCSRCTSRIRVSQMVVSLGHCLPRSSACPPSYRGNPQERKKRHGWKHTSKRNLIHAVTLSFLRNKECNDQDNPCLRPLPPCSPSTKKPEIYS